MRARHAVERGQRRLARDLHHADSGRGLRQRDRERQHDEQADGMLPPELGEPERVQHLELEEHHRGPQHRGEEGRRCDRTGRTETREPLLQRREDARDSRVPRAAVETAPGERPQGQDDHENDSADQGRLLAQPPEERGVADRRVGRKRGQHEEQQQQDEGGRRNGERHRQQAGAGDHSADSDEALDADHDLGPSGGLSSGAECSCPRLPATTRLKAPS